MSPNGHSSKPRIEKLRTSCDSCHLSKVKCSKTRPLCSRCLVCGTDCTYSPSARVGRKSKKGNHTPNSSVTQTGDALHDTHNQPQTSLPPSYSTPCYENDEYSTTQFSQEMSHSSTARFPSGTVTPAPSDGLDSLLFMDPHSIHTSDSWIQTAGLMDYFPWEADVTYSPFPSSETILSSCNVPWSTWYSPYNDQGQYINPGVVQYPCDTSGTVPKDSYQ